MFLFQIFPSSISLYQIVYLVFNSKLSGKTDKTKNVCLAKARGFPNIRCRQALLDESYDPATASRQPRMEVDFYPKHVLANVCDIDFLQIDVVKDNLITNVEAFRRKSGKSIIPNFGRDSHGSVVWACKLWA